MRFPRTAKIFRAQLDFAPLAGVFFLLVLFLLLSRIFYTPGVLVELPKVAIKGTMTPDLAVAMDSQGQLYFENQLIQENQLLDRLKIAVQKSSEPLSLLLQPDKAVTYEKLVRVAALAQEAGIRETVFAT